MSETEWKQAYIRNAMSIESTRNSVITGRYTGSSFIQYDSTTYHAFTSEIDNFADTAKCFLTPIYSNQEMTQEVGTLVGFVNPANENQTFTVIFRVDDPVSNGSRTVHVETLDGDDLGDIVINNDGFMSSYVVSTESTGQSRYVTARRGWLDCVSDCIGDAKQACKNDPKCFALMISTQVVASVMAQGIRNPAGTAINIACGAACLRHPDLDLMPQWDHTIM